MESTMAWTETTRRNYVRRTSRYASDLTDREWEFIAPFLPAPRRLGRPRKTDLRQVVNALLYIASTGCQWRMLSKDFAPCSTVQRYFYEWRAMGLWSRINHYLVMEARELEGKEASPTAGASTAKASSRLKAAVFGALMRARRSKAASATSLSILSGGGVALT
jgi:transposase